MVDVIHVVGCERSGTNYAQFKRKLQGCYGPIIWNMLEQIERSPRGELEISDVNRLMLKQYFVDTCEIEGWWCDAGTQQSLLKANNEVITNLHPRLNSRLNMMSEARRNDA